ncbi:hypothetical protein [Chryseolinea soli]|nr:hypothetical protein [Chryseolinea soli]
MKPIKNHDAEENQKDITPAKEGQVNTPKSNEIGEDKEKEIIGHLDDFRKIIESVINLSPLPNSDIEKLSLDFTRNAKCHKVCVTIAGKEVCWCQV